MDRISHSILRTFIPLLVLPLMLLRCPVARPQDPAGPAAGRERYVPADQLDAVFERSPQGVMLPRAEFQQLLKKAQQALAEHSGIPAAIVVREAVYQIEQADSHALVKLSLDIEQFADHWVTLNIPTGNLLVEEASIDDTPAVIGRPASDTEQIVLMHRSPGRFTLQLTLSTPLGTVGSDRVAAFRTIENATCLVRVACPADRHLEVNDLELQRPAPVAEPTEYVVPVGTSPQLRLKWTARRQETDMQTLVFARTDGKIRLSSDNLRWDSATRVSVFGNTINQVVARVPAALEVTAVESTGLESWKLEDDPTEAGFTRVLLNYRQPFRDDRLINLSAVAPLQADANSPIPTLELVNVTAHSGRLYVAHEDQLRLLAQAGDGIRHLGTSEESSGQPRGEVFDFWLQRFQLSVGVRPRDRELFAEVNSTLTLADTTAEFSGSITVETLNAPLFELVLQLPQGWRIGDITDGENNTLQWRSGSQPDQIIVEPAASIPAGGLFSLKVQLSRTIDDPTTAQMLDLPVLTASDSLVVGGTYQISTARDLTVAPVDIQGLAPIGDEDGMLLFQIQNTTWSARLSIARRPVRLSARSVLRSWMDLRQKTTEAVVTADIINGTTRSLTLILPEELGADVRFSVVSITQVPGVADQQVPAAVTITEQRPGTPENGQRAFHLTFDRRFAGSLTLRTLVQQPRTDETRLTAPFVKVTNAVRQHGLIAFEAYPEQQLAPDEVALADSGLKPADAALVQPPPETSGRRTALVFRYVQPDYSLQIQETRFDTESVPSAVCERIANISLLSETGAVQRSSRMELRCVGVQTLRFALPDAERSFLWSTILNGEAVEVRRDETDYLVALPVDSGQTEHVLEILFESADQPSSSLGRATQESVQLAIDGDDGSAAAIEILEQTWDVRYPASSLLLDHDGGFHPLSGVDQPGWLQQAAELMHLPTLPEAGRRLTPVTILLLILFVITVLVIRRRWKSLAACCLLLVVVPLLLLPARQYARVDSAASVADYMEDSVMYEGEEFSGAGGGYGGRSTGSANDSAESMGESGNIPQSGFGGGERGPTNRFRRDLSVNGAVPEAGAYGGGMGGGGFGGPAIAFDDLSIPQEPTSEPAAQTATPAPPAAQAEGTAGRRFVQPSDGGVMQEQIQDQERDAEQADELFSFDTRAAGQRKAVGTARLSVRADIAEPADFRSMKFRSIGATPSAGELQIVVQKRSQLQALRVASMAVVLLICLWINRAGLAFKLGLAVVLLTAAVASVPLLPNQWQSLADGVAMGVIAGIGLWIVFGLVRGVVACWQSCCRNGCCGFFKPRRAAMTLLVGSLLSWATGPVVAEPQADGDSVEASDTVQPDVVVPYTPGRPELLAERVFLPRDQFLKLYRAAYPEEFATPGKPDDGRVVAAFYRSTELKQIDDSKWSQQFSVRYVIRSFSDQPVDVALPIEEVAVRSATLNGTEAVLLGNTHQTSVSEAQVQIQQVPNQAALQQGKPQPPGTAGRPGYRVRIPSDGLHLLDIIFEVPSTVNSSVGQVTLPLLPVPAGTLRFQLPEENLEAMINNRSNIFRRDRELLTVPIAEAHRLRIDWRPSTSQQVSDTTWHTTVNSALQIDDAGLTVRSSIVINCRQGKLAEVEITIPGDYAVQAVEGTEVAGWSQEDGGSVLKLLFRQPVETTTSVQLTLFRRQVFSTSSETIDVPVPAVRGASRDSGHVTVIAGRELEIRVHSLSGVTQMNAAEAALPAGIADDARRVLAWRYTRHPAEIAVRVFRTGDRLKVSMLNGVQLDPQRQLWTTLVTAEISGSPRRRLELKVPLDFLALDVSANDLADWYFSDAPEENSTYRILNLQLNAARVGVVNAVIQGQTGRADAVGQAFMTVPEVLHADETTTHLSIWLDEASEIASSETPGWKKAGGEVPIDPRILQLQPDAPDISFLSSAISAQPVTLSLRQAPASLIAESVFVTNITDTSVDLTLGLNWQISRAATRSLSFTLPEQLSDVFDFQIPGLRQLQIAPAEDGRVQFTVQLQQPASERFFIMGTGTLPLPESRQITAPTTAFTVSAASSASIASQSHFWVIVNQSAGLLEAVNRDTDGPDVAPDEIRTRIPRGFLQQSVAIRRLRSDRPNSPWALKFPERQKVAPAVVALAAHTTIISEDGTWRSRHVLQVRNESRQFLPVELPGNSRFLYCLVKGRPTRVVSRSENDRTLHLIPVPQSGEISTPFEVQFALAGVLQTLPRDLNARRVEIPIPTFPEYRDRPDYGIMVSRNTWSVYVPETWQASMLDNPRDTNVISAGEGDFEDATLLSFVDNAKSIVNSVRSSKTAAPVQGLYDDLQVQLFALQDQRGNTTVAEEQRIEALQELELLLGENLESETRVLSRAGSGGETATSGVTREALGINSYLWNKESDQNRFNFGNNLDLIISNSPAGVLEAPRSSGEFKFALPAEQQGQQDKFRDVKDLSKLSEIKEAAEKPGSVSNRSQLLERREQNLKQQSEQLMRKSGVAGKKMERETAPEPRRAQRGEAQANDFAAQIQQPTDGQDGLQAGDQLSAPFGMVAAPPISGRQIDGQGLLSLQFSIPEDGIRHDFVRTGGNAALTLKVRDAESIEYAAGILWTAVCVVVCLLLLKGESAGRLLRRVLVLLIVLGMAGGLVLPEPLQIAALLVCLVAAGVLSVTWIAASFRRRPAA
ncbi:MAG: hypothetical protein RIK87_14825 [Fuerstiella sp.]